MSDADDQGPGSGAEDQDKVEGEDQTPFKSELDEQKEKDKLWIRTYNFTDDQLAELKECFAMFDSTGNGVIPASNLGTALRAMGQNPSEADVQEMLQEANLDDNGNLTLDEYIKTVGSRGLKTEPEMEEELEEALRVFDKQGEGWIDAEELRNILRSYGEILDDDDISELLKVAEVAGDGKINYLEFMKKMTTK